MKLNWLQQVAVAVSLVAGSIGSTALAGNKGGPAMSGGTHSFQGGNTAVRSIGSTQNFQPQIKTLSGNGLPGVQLQGRQHSPSLNVPQLNNAVQGIQLKNQLDLTKKLGVGGNAKLPFNPDLTKKIDGAFGKPQLPFNPDLNKKLGGALDPKFHINPDIAHKINGAILDKKCMPGCFPGCKPGCFPWWWSPFWGSCYLNYPCYYYPTYYTQPIIVPVAQTVTTAAPVAGVVDEQLMQVPVGATLTLQANNLGDKAGQVILQIDKISLPAQVGEWKNDSVTATLPMIGLNGNVRAEIMLIKPDGSLANSVKVELIPAQLPTESQSAEAAR